MSLKGKKDSLNEKCPVTLEKKVKSIIILIFLILATACGKKDYKATSEHQNTVKQQAPFFTDDKSVIVLEETVGKTISYYFDVNDFDSTFQDLKVEILQIQENPNIKIINGYEGNYLLKWTPSVNDIGEKIIKLVVTDEKGLKQEKKLIIKIKPNIFPSLNLIKSHFITTVGIPFELKLNLIDPDSNNNHLVELTKKPKGMSLNPNRSKNSFKLDWTPQKGQDLNTLHEVTIKIKDEFKRTQTKKLTFLVEKNKKPLIKPNHKIKEGTVGVPLNYEIMIEDDNKDFSQTVDGILENPPPGMRIKFIPYSKLFVINWTPNKEQFGVYKVNFKVYDKYSGHTKKELIFIIVKNKLPIVKNSKDVINTKPNKPIRIRLVVEDQDTPIKKLTFKLISPPNGVKLDQFMRIYSPTINWTPKRSDVGEKKIVVKITDNLSGESVLHTFLINVRPFTAEEKKKLALKNWDKLKRNEKKKIDRKKRIIEKWTKTIDKSISKKRAKKNWGKLTNKLMIINRFKPDKKLPMEVISQRGSFFTLEKIKSTINFPKYSQDEKLIIAKQAQNILNNYYVNLKVKIDDFGNEVDPTVKMNAIVREAKDISEKELHTRISGVFNALRDGHLNYFLPLPHACFKSSLPLGFNFARNERGEEKVYLTNIAQYEKFLAKGINPSILDNLSKIRKGFILNKYNGIFINKALEKANKHVRGSNLEAQKRRSLTYLTSRHHKVDFIPKLDQVKLEFLNKVGNSIEITLPWLTSYECREESDGTLISTYKKFPEAKSFNIKRKSLNHNMTATNWVTIKDGKYLTYGISDNRIGYLFVPTFSPDDVDKFWKEIVDFLNKIKNKRMDRLIVDVRSNGGGNLILAVILLQLLTEEKISYTPFRFKNTARNIAFLGNPLSSLKMFIPLAKELENSDEYYSSAIPLYDDSMINYFQPQSFSKWFKRIDVITNSNCYSACDIFVSQMQDHKSAKIWGINAKQTGAGGAVVWTYSDLKNRMPKVFGLDPLDTLPGGQEMRFSYFQSIRNKLNEGKILENTGVRADQVIYFNEKDLSNQFGRILKDIEKDFY